MWLVGYIVIRHNYMYPGRRFRRTCLVHTKIRGMVKTILNSSRSTDYAWLPRSCWRTAEDPPMQRPWPSSLRSHTIGSCQNFNGISKFANLPTIPYFNMRKSVNIAKRKMPETEWRLAEMILWKLECFCDRTLRQEVLRQTTTTRMEWASKYHIAGR